MFYDLVAWLLRSVAWWGRMRVEGLERLSASGPLLVVANHDSQWDPILIGLAAKPRRRLRYLGRASLWRIPGLAPVLRGLRQIPVRRGAGDTVAISTAVDALCVGGEAVCIFPEGGLSWGEAKRARGGVGRLAQACAEARVVLCAIAGATDYVRFPRRPSVTVTFFAPERQPEPGEEPRELAARLLAQVRGRVPPAPAGRAGRIGPPRRVTQRSEATRASRS